MITYILVCLFFCFIIISLCRDIEYTYYHRDWYNGKLQWRGKENYKMTIGEILLILILGLIPMFNIIFFSFKLIVITYHTNINVLNSGDKGETFVKYNLLGKSIVTKTCRVVYYLFSLISKFLKIEV